jgi:hypothetical protein
MTDNALPSDDIEFQLSLQGEDELGVVIRAHIYIESKLNALLERLLSSPKHLEKMNLEYSQRVQLAVAMGLLPQYESPLLALGTLRNHFAHRPGTKLSKDKVNNLYSSLSSEDKQLIQQSHDRTRRNLKTETTVQSFSRLTPKDQFILIAVALRALLHVAYKEAAARRGGA